MTKPIYTRSDYEHWVERIVADGVNLTTFEETFIDSIDLQLRAHRDLTDKQAALLERIYTERVP